MTEQQRKELPELAIKLRVLKGPEKNRYLYELDEYAKDCKVRDAYKQPRDMFLPHRLACHMYNSIEGTPYVQPEMNSQITWKDLLARRKFEAIFAGVTAYVQATDEEKAAFKKSALTSVNAVQKVVSLVKSACDIKD